MKLEDKLRSPVGNGSSFALRLSRLKNISSTWYVFGIQSIMKPCSLPLNDTVHEILLDELDPFRLETGSAVKDHLKYSVLHQSLAQVHNISHLTRFEVPLAALFNQDFAESALATSWSKASRSDNGRCPTKSCRKAPTQRGLQNQ